MVTQQVVHIPHPTSPLPRRLHRPRGYTDHHTENEFAPCSTGTTGAECAEKHLRPQPSGEEATGRFFGEETDKGWEGSAEEEDAEGEEVAEPLDDRGERKDGGMW